LQEKAVPTLFIPDLPEVHNQSSGHVW